MKNEGWTLSDLDGELSARGIDMREVNLIEYDLNCPTAEEMAQAIERNMGS